MLRRYKWTVALLLSIAGPVLVLVANWHQHVSAWAGALYWFAGSVTVGGWLARTVKDD